MKPFLLIAWWCACASLLAASTSARRYSVADIETAIRSGKIGQEYAERAKKLQELHVAEIRGQKIPYQLFTFSDFQGGYTLLIEAEVKFVVLCSAVGGGFAYDFTMAKESGTTTLHYRYTSGSGRRFEHRGRYVIGSGKPKEIAAVRDITP